MTGTTAAQRKKKSKSRTKEDTKEFRGSFQNKLHRVQQKTEINADICPTRFDMLKRNNRTSFNQFQEFQEEHEYEAKHFANF